MNPHTFLSVDAQVSVPGREHGDERDPLAYGFNLPEREKR